MSASGQDQNGLGAQPASAVGDLPQPVLIDGKERWQWSSITPSSRTDAEEMKCNLGN